MARNSKLVSDSSLLEAALEGLEIQRQRIEEQMRQVRGLLGKGRASANNDGTPLKKRQLSSAARKRIAAAQKKRWAEYRKTAVKE